SLIERRTVLCWILAAFAILNPILFVGQLVTGVLFEYQLASVRLYREFGVATVAGMVFLDVAMVSRFGYFLFKNPPPTSSTGQFSGNSEAHKQWNRTGIIAKYGAFSCGASFLVLAFIVANQLVPPPNEYMNLLSACGYSAAGLSAITLLVMKIKLEGGYGKLFASTAKSEFASTARSEDYGKVIDEEV
ncbi:hypothetical protein HDU81_009939, partial [Chytriomyces hyalinus]